MSTFIVFYALMAVMVVAALVVELKRDLMMLQQNSYRAERYARWLRTSADTTSTSRLIAMILFFLSLVHFGPAVGVCAMALMGIFGVCVFIRRVQARYKHPLAFTGRARRIYAVDVVLSAGMMTGMVFVFDHQYPLQILFTLTVTAMGLYVGSHLLTLAANALTLPYQAWINRRFYRQAQRRLASMPQLTIIGITGSYGKTSTKHYLHRLLSEKYHTLMTPGSYNTTLGVVRTINEMLKPTHQVFIVEMGAKNIGDIREICQLVHPRVGIVTAVGEQHLESFKTLENVCRTKFELIDSLPSDGLGVINQDFPKAAERPVTNVPVVRYSAEDAPGSDLRAEDIEYTPRGTRFRAVATDWSLEIHTRLMGELNVNNLLGAIAVARYMGLTDSEIQYGAEQIEPVEHRLSLRHTSGGVTVLDDAFNSNPRGSHMALDVLHHMPGRRIVVTPGMIELGQQQEAANRQLGRDIDAAADLAFIVGQYNRQALLDGIHEGGRLSDEQVIVVDTFADAQARLTPMLRRGDVVLYENDLPDTFH